MVDSMITLFDSVSTEFTTNGLGSLPDATSCTVVEERNGKFELEMEYPITGRHYEEFQLRRIIVVKPNPYSNPQPFRIYSITKPMNGIVTVNAAHISYDLSGYPVSPFVADTAVNAFTNMKRASAVTCPFTFYTDKSTAAKMTILKPSTMRSLLGGVSGSILDVYGGEYEFDGFAVRLLNHRGSNRGVSIRYGKNLTDLEQEENCSSVYTGVYPFWYSEQDGLIELPEKTIGAAGAYNFTRIYPLDLSGQWQDPPTQEEIRAAARSYITANNIGVPKVSLKVSFVQLGQDEECREFALLETVHLCDTVNVEFPELNVSAVSKCVSTTYNVLTGKYDEIELGDSRSNLASTISLQSQAINDAPSRTKTFTERAIENATQLISGGLGGYVIMRDSSGGKHPDEILIMDTDNIQTANKVWRWNKAGLGYSSKGYNGPYTTAITQDGAIVANFISTGELNGGLIKADSIRATSLSVEYKDAVTREIESKFQVNAEGIRLETKRAGDAEGALRTSIGDEVERASAAEAVLSSSITLNTDGIRLETKRAWDAEGVLRTSIGDEVNRASAAEAALKSSIELNADGIKLKVSKSDVESIIEQKADSIRLKASKISWASDNSSMTDEGFLKCKSAELNGTFLCGSEESYWLKLDSGVMKGGFGSSEYGHIDYSATMDNLLTGNEDKGIQISCGTLRISANSISTRSTQDESAMTYIGGTGTLKVLLADSEYEWAILRFENGLMVTELPLNPL